MIKVRQLPLIFVSTVIICFFTGFINTDLYASTISPATCSNSDIQTAINQAQAGDTVSVPSGSCTWTSGISITKGLTLQGAGISSTIITDGLNSSGCPGSCPYMITYQPSNPGGNETLRITGFRFNLSGVQGIYLYNQNDSTFITNIRVDHINFSGSGCISGSIPCIRIRGNVGGVVDNNIFTGSTAFQFTGGDTGTWSNISPTFGDAGPLYIEDNTFTMTNTPIDASRGTRWVARYNTFTYNGANSLSPWFDAHGDYGDTQLCSTLTTEAYGNYLVDSSNRLGTLFDLRGGSNRTFYNYTTNSLSPTGVNIRDEYYGNGGCSGQTAESQKPRDIYIWSNRQAAGNLLSTGFVTSSGTASGGGNNYLDDSSKNFNFCESGCPQYAYGVKITGGTGSGQFRVIQSITSTRLTISPNWTTNPSTDSTYEIRHSAADTINENSEFWTMRSTGVFNGSGLSNVGGGVGAGPLASRPSACTVGVGYWATDQSISDLSGMVGSSPANPISGTLYKCTSTNTWTTYYTPYTYPHPLRITLSSAKAISAFDFNILNPDVIGSIDENNHTISLTVPYNTDLNSLVPTITHTGVSISPNSGVAANFNSPKTYTVTAADSSEQNYVVTVSLSPAPTPTPGQSGGGSSGGGSSGGGSSGGGSSGSSVIVYYNNPIVQNTNIKSATTSGLLPNSNNVIAQNQPRFQNMFYRNLSLNMTGVDVMNLQKLLNYLGFTIAKTGSGSPNNETKYFGMLTYKALVKFQRSAGLPSTGFFGPMTRAYIKNKNY